MFVVLLEAGHPAEFKGKNARPPRGGSVKLAYPGLVQKAAGVFRRKHKSAAPRQNGNHKILC